MTSPLVFKDAREWGELVARVFSGDAPAEIVPPGIILASEKPEWAVLRGEVPWNHSRTIGALAASFSSLTVQQLQTTDRITVVQRVVIINAQAAVQTYKLGEVAAAGAGTATKAASRDQRRLVVSTAVEVIQQAADQLGSVQAIPVAANSTLIFDMNWMLSAVNGLVLQGGVVNQEVTAWFFGYERRLREEERKLD